MQIVRTFAQNDNPVRRYDNGENGREPLAPDKCYNRQFSVGIFSAWSTTICSTLDLRCSSLSPSFCTDE